MEHFKRYFSLCLLKGTLIGLPDSSHLFRNSLLLYLALGYFIQANISEPVIAFIEVSVEALLSMLFVACVLWISKSKMHFLPTATAFLNCENFIYVLGIPVVLWLTVSDDLLGFYLCGLLIIWAIAIITYIIRQIVSYSMGVCIMISVCYYIVVYVGTFFAMLAVF